MLPGEELTLTPDSITSRVRGSKFVLVVEQSMILTIWGCKICLLLMYNKLTFGLKQHLAVKVVAAYVVVIFVVMEVLYLGVWCRPLNMYWQVPVNNGMWFICRDPSCLTFISSMLSCDESSHHQCRLQYLIRYHDALHSFAITDYITTSKSEVCSPP